MKVLTYFLAAVGLLASTAGSVGTVIVFWDEPTAPKSLLK
jgi:cyclic lactone autoinducer peptide